MENRIHNNSIIQKYCHNDSKGFQNTNTLGPSGFTLDNIFEVITSGIKRQKKNEESLKKLDLSLIKITGTSHTLNNKNTPTLMSYFHMYSRLMHKTLLRRETVAYIHMVSLNE